MLQAWARRVGTLAGWRRHGLAFLLGVGVALAFAPVHAAPFMLLHVPLVWLLSGAGTARRAFFTAWCFAFGQFLAGLYWTGISFLVDPAAFAILLPLPILGLPAALALIPASAVAIAFRLSAPRWHVIAFALAWFVAEYVRGHALTGFPWNIAANVWAFSDHAMQMFALLGAYGLTLLTLVWTMALADLGWRRWAWPALTTALLAAVLVAGALRLPVQPDAVVDGVRLRLVQGNIDQVEKWQSDKRVEHVQKHMRLSVEAVGDAPAPTHVVWPESAIPFVLDYDASARAALATVVPADGLLLAGGLRATPRGTQPFRVWNSLLVLDPLGEVRGAYDKRHLVPFGEYLPLRPILAALGLEKLVPGSSDFSSGTGDGLIRPPGLPPARVLICYEAIFPDEVVTWAEGQRPSWLLNVTNDGWFGHSSGPFQHLDMARARAVEQGLPLARAANTGVSAIVDGHGRVLASLALGQTGVVDGPLPQPVAPPPYARWGEWLTLALLFLLAALATAARWR